MQATTMTQRADMIDQLAFFGAQYLVVATVFATLAYTLSTLV
jgi:hypothetical protein